MNYPEPGKLYAVDPWPGEDERVAKVTAVEHDIVSYKLWPHGQRVILRNLESFLKLYPQEVQG
jgi:hypothetical protein